MYGEIDQGRLGIQIASRQALKVFQATSTFTMPFKPSQSMYRPYVQFVNEQFRMLPG